MASKLEWHGKEFEQHLRNATATGLRRAGTFYWQKCRETVSRPNTGVSVKVTRPVPGGNKRTRTIYPNPSKPGEPPKLRTGFGRRNVVVNHDPKGKFTRVGVTENGMYMFFLEIGTHRIARRPWLLKTLIDNQEMIGKLAATGDKK